MAYAVEARARLHAILDELDITGTVRVEMGLEPERALAVIEQGRRARGIKNRAGWIVTLWRRSTAEARVAAAQPLLEPGPPSLEALEYVWSGPPTATRQALLDLLASAIGLNGGFARMRPPAAP